MTNEERKYHRSQLAEWIRGAKRDGLLADPWFRGAFWGYALATGNGPQVDRILHRLR